MDFASVIYEIMFRIWQLSYAISILGNPKIVLLDEPSTGMDPQSKRYLWDTVLDNFRGERGAVLTTHSMEEADFLCSRVGIMVHGELKYGFFSFIFWMSCFREFNISASF